MSAPAPFPMAELHCHAEGALPVARARALARREGVDLGALAAGERYDWEGFTGFLQAYDRVAALLRAEEDYRDLASAYLGGIARAGALYGELFVSPDHARAAGLEPARSVAALGEGCAQAERETGIVARLVVVGVRHLGAEAVEAAARFAVRAALEDPRVSGFGLAGDERMHRPRDFARAFAIAGEAGLGLTAHAGEFAGADAVRETVDELGVSRIGHGVRAIEDEAVVARLREGGVTLEVCPGSNLALDLYPSLGSHPLRRLHEAGLRVTVSSDDPPFFGTDLPAEYERARRMGFGAAERVALTRNALEAAFVDEPTRRALLTGLMRRAISLGAAGGSD